MFLSNLLMVQILTIIITIVFLICTILYLLSLKIYNIIYGKRLDKTFLHFFTHEDFEGLKAEKIEFKTTNNNTLRGYIYSYEKENYLGLMIVSHGLGVGHLQYTKEIEHFAKLGFKVLAFDNTGCAKSDGEMINGLPQGIFDLKSCIEYVKTRDDLKFYPKVLFGHSWGGYSSLNVSPFLTDLDNIKCIVTMGAPFNSGEITYQMLVQSSKTLNFTKPFIKMIERNRFSEVAKMNTLATLENTNYDVLMVHGDQDNIVNYIDHFQFVIDNLTRKNVEFLKVENKRHRPNISLRATEYDKKVNDDIINLKKKKASKEDLKNYHDQIDYTLLTEFDDDVMNKIDEFILNHFN